MARTLHGLALGLMCWIGAAEFCSTFLGAGCKMGPLPTLCDRLDAADVVYYAQPVLLADDTVGWNILQTLKSGAPSFRPGEMPELPLALPDNPRQGRLEGYAIFGERAGSNTLTDWTALKITPAAARYLREMPHRDPWRPEATHRERLLYVLDHLEHEDEIIADSAAEEIRQTEFDDLTLVLDELPLKKLRVWLQSDKTKSSLIGVYGLLLGLRGTTADAEILKAVIVRPTEEFRLNMDLLMSGYLLLAGEPGLAVIEEAKIKNPEAPFNETYAAMGAIRFMWKHGRNQLGRERLQSSMRLLLDRPELVDLVVADLARMEDWSVQDRLLELYDDPECDVPAVKRAIVRYFLHCAEFQPEFPNQPEPARVSSAKRHLGRLIERDPKTVEQAKRLYRIRKS